MPVFNYYYNQHLLPYEAQQAPESPLAASPKYRILQTQDSPPEGDELVQTVGGLQVWQNPAALPFAFTVPSSAIGSGVKLTKDAVAEVPAGYAGTNHIVATVNSPGTQPETLAVLVTHYPGWRVTVDGQPAPLTLANGYLGVQVLPGEHKYTFEFDPPLYRLGAVISIITLIAVVIMLVFKRESRYLA
jgi:uncharacterized membrane protein YfhO